MHGPKAHATRHAWPAIVAILSFLLGLPSLWVGLFADDYFHRAAILGSRVFGEFVSGPMDMFAFFDGDAARTRRLMDLGFLPWWTYTDLKGAFWRPVTVFTHWLDYRLWPNLPALMHTHSLLWFAALAGIMAGLYRRLLPSATLAALAALLYAVDDAHGMPVGFLANRNALICGTLGGLCLIAHDLWRCDGRRWAALAGPLLLALALLAKEEGVAVCAYLFVYAVFLERGSPARRVATLIPYALIVVVWRIVWSLLGYGVENVGFYVDPLHEPLRFTQAVFQRLPYLVLGQLALPPSEIVLLRGIIEPSLVDALWWVGAVLTIGLFIVLATAGRRDPRIGFFTVGMLLALLLACATFPSDRMFTFSGIGAMGLLAQLLVYGWQRAARAGASWAARVGPGLLVAAIVAIHLVVAPVGLALRAGYPAGRTAMLLSPELSLDPSIAEQTLVLTNPPNLLQAAYVLLIGEAHGQPLPPRVRVLAPGLTAVELQRVDDRTLRVRPHGSFVSWPFERLFRDERFPMHVGQRIELTGMSAEVTETTAEGWPAEALMHFPVNLDDPSLRWVCFRDGRFVPFHPPPVGAQVTLPAASLGL